MKTVLFLLSLVVVHEAAAGPVVRLRQHRPIPGGKPGNFSGNYRGKELQCPAGEEEDRLVAAVVLFSIAGLGIVANAALVLLILGTKSLRRFVGPRGRPTSAVSVNCVNYWL